MPKTYKLDRDKKDEISLARKGNRDKQVEKRLLAVQLRMEGKKNREIAEQLGTSSDVVSRWVSQYAKGGVAALMPKKRQRTDIPCTEAAWLAQGEAVQPASQKGK